MDRRYEIWEKIRDELRRLRGMNRIRGREEHLLPKGQVRIPVEVRGNESLVHAEVVIYLSKVESELYAVRFPDERKIKLDEMNMDLRRFMEEVADMARGKNYLVTNSKSANYRKPT